MVDSKSLIFILLVSLLLVTMSSASHKDRDLTVEIEENNGNFFLDTNKDSLTIQYDNNNPQPITIYLNCDGADCPYAPNDGPIRDTLYVDICGERITARNRASRSDTYTNEIGFPLPESKCSVGTHSAQVYDRESGGHKVYDINTEFVIDYPHGEVSSGMLAVTMGLDGVSNNLINWQLYNAGAFDDGSEKGQVRVVEADTLNDNVLVRDAGTGVILSQQNTGSGYIKEINNFLRNPISSGGIGAGVYDVATKEIGTNLGPDCRGGNCPLGRFAGEDPTYQIPGEIIMGEQFDSSSNNWPSGNISDLDKNFHVCDPRVDGQYEIEGKNVYSPPDPAKQGANNYPYDSEKFDHDYFECRDGQWIERPKCDPGYEWKKVSGNWICDELDDVTMEIEFLNVTNIGFKKFKNGYPAGFKVPAEEAQKFEDLYDATLQWVNAECWMGKLDERPVPAETGIFAEIGENSSAVAVDARDFKSGGSFEDIWVLTDLPYRDSNAGVSNNKTYSCLYGFEGRTSSGVDISQNTNTFNLNSRDKKRIEVKLSYVQDRKSTFSSSTYSRDWPFDPTNNDGRDSIPIKSKLNPLISFRKEHPYCPFDAALHNSGRDVNC